jgi:hypothetical protein
VLPEPVRKEDVPASSAPNGIELNVARGVGHALAGALTAAAGVGAAFLVNIVSFPGLIVAVARGKRPLRARTVPAERCQVLTLLRSATFAMFRSRVP